MTVGTGEGGVRAAVAAAEPCVRLGAVPVEGDGCLFRVWAPAAEAVTLRLLEPVTRAVRLERDDAGYHGAMVAGVAPGALYVYELAGGARWPDPASRAQPRGVHGPSQVVDPRFDWRAAAWRAPGGAELVLYELHVGTFTPEGTFDAVIPRLDELRALGVNAIELMPVAQFPGERNWGYDGAFPFAAQWSYGGPDGLRRLVDACHERDMAVFLDVVHNHVGPEGIDLRAFGPYFTDTYHTPWGAALNFAGPGSDEVRRFFIDSALYWTVDCRVDGLRLDAVHAIVDPTPRPFLEALAERVHAEAARRGRRVWLVAESDANDPRLVRSPERGGYGLDAHWSDDFHHALHALLTGERQGYYRDFGAVSHLARAFRGGYAYTGQYSAHRGRGQGRSPDGIAARRFVVFAQNHDQVGNRPRGRRLSALVDFEAQKLAAATVLLSPFVPLLFMGEEWGERAPFPYFVSHGDADLVEAVRRGRRREFRDFDWDAEPPDPQSPDTFRAARLSRADDERARTLRSFYRELLRLRRGLWARERPPAELATVMALEAERVLLATGTDVDGGAFALLLNFGGALEDAALPLPPGEWHVALDTAATRWGGPHGSDWSPRGSGGGAGRGGPGGGPHATGAVMSDGRARLDVAPHSALLFVHPTRSP